MMNLLGKSFELTPSLHYMHGWRVSKLSKAGVGARNAEPSEPERRELKADS
jgi:hypothetical protein